jgi:hypothetical protein
MRGQHRSGVPLGPLALNPTFRIQPMSFELIFLAVPTLLVVALIYKQYDIFKKKRMNFAWYCMTHPTQVGRDGRASCFQCNGRSVATERLMGRTFLRRHICRTCGTTLYYSPEK